MGLVLKKNIARIFAFMIVSVFSGILSQGAVAASSTCPPGDSSWPCFAAERSAKRVAKKSFRAKRALMRRAARRRALSRKKIRNARKYRRTLKSSRSRKTRNSTVLYINKNGQRISKRRAAALALKRTKNRARRRNKNKKMRHLHKKKKSAYNRGFSLRGRHMRVTSAAIKTSCFPARLKRLISRVEKRYGKRLIVTSGFRSHSHNRRVGGASRSEHVHCKAVDFRIPGVNKYSLARFVKRLPGVGGVGTYCNKSTIHMDVGKRRSWNYCGKRRSRKRYAKRHRSRRSRSYRTTSARRSQRARWNFNF